MLKDGVTYKDREGKGHTIACSIKKAISGNNDWVWATDGSWYDRHTGRYVVTGLIRLDLLQKKKLLMI